MTDLYLGIDVGTASARAGLFDATGKMHGAATRQIDIHRPQADFAEQSSDNIWEACGEAVRAALQQAGARPEKIKGIGFDATCSLVVLGDDDQSVTVSPTGDDHWNIIMWMDHRAIGQAERINVTGHDVLRYVGGVISPEMESPKLLWLKENLPGTWGRAAHLFDLPDWLVHRATGTATRSLCTTVCKWTHLGHADAAAEGSVGRWDESYFRAIGLGDLVDEKFRRIGTRVRPMGERVGGLTRQAAEDLHLVPGTPVGVAIIDAHAGGLGVIGAPLEGRAPSQEDFDRRLALIGGTSSCHMACSPEPRFIPGVWGPYFSAMIPGLWLTEGGQSATGSLIDHVIISHARAAELEAQARASGRATVHEELNARLERLAASAPFPASLTRDLHVLPYFHGNRSPRADPALRGVISGLRLDDSADALALLYLATVQAVALGARHIIQVMNEKGYRIDTVFACGGGTKNPVFLREHADATGCRIVLPRESEAVLLGSAILGAVAAGAFGSIIEAMGAMNAAGEIIEPSSSAALDFHSAKFRVFLRMCEDLMAWRGLMRGA